MDQTIARRLIRCYIRLERAYLRFGSATWTVAIERSIASRRCSLSSDVANADDADQTVIVDDRQMAHVVLVHEMTNVLGRIAQTAADQLQRNQLRNLQIETGRAVICNCADHVAFCKHTDRGIALGPDNVLNHKRAYLVSAHQLRGNGDGFVHSDRNNARGFLAQHVSDLHHNLLQMAGHRARRIGLGRGPFLQAVRKGGAATSRSTIPTRLSRARAGTATGAATELTLRPTTLVPHHSKSDHRARER